MNAENNDVSAAELPTPHLRYSHYPTLIIWIVPLLAAVGASFYLYQLYQTRGPEITISFKDTSGIKTGETPLTIHGVKIGSVTQVDLAADNESSIVHVQLERHAARIAKETSVFWLVRPEVGGGNLSGLGTVISGPYIEGVVGNGPDRTDFIGSDRAPLMLGEGVRVILRSPRIEHVQLATPVFFRGIQVGQVQDIRLGDDSTTVNLTLFIWAQYAPLLRSDSMFWSVTGADVKGNVFTGVDLHLGSLRSVLGGGIMFATPDPSSDKSASVPATDGTEYILYEEPKKEWLDWSPKIELPKSLKADITGLINPEPTGLHSAVRVK